MVSHDQVVSKFCDELAVHGITIDRSRVQLDGKLHRLHVEGDRQTEKNLAYKIHFDERPAGWFKDHKRGPEGTFSVLNGSERLAGPELEAAKARWRAAAEQRDREQSQAYAEAAREAAQRISAAAPCDTHPYLDRKGLPTAPKLRVDADGLLLVPVYSDFDVISSVQTISPDGEKLFMPGGKMAGGFFTIIGPVKDRVLVCEGLATGIALNKATNYSVACAMFAANVPAVVKHFESKLAGREIIAAVDNDRWQSCRQCQQDKVETRIYLPDHPTICPACNREHKSHNAGLEYGAKSGVRVFAPDFDQDHDQKWTDWDDWLRHCGTPDMLLKSLSGQPEPPQPSPPPPAAPPGSDEPPPPEQPGYTPGDPWPEPINLGGAFEPPIVRAEWLPPAIVPFVFDQSEMLGSDPSVLALACIVACAAVIHDGIEIQPKRHDPTWKEQARLWGAVVGDPSTRKTPAIGKAIKHVRKLDMNMAEESAPKRAEYDRQLKIYKKREQAFINADAKGDVAGSPPEPPQEPPVERLMAEDITVEALSNVLKDNVRGVLIFNDELSGWFGAMDAYKAGGKDRSLWLEAYNGGPKRVDRIGRGSILVPNWSTCIIGGIQPDAIRKISGQMYEDGLLQRFMVVCGKGLNNAAQDRPPNMQAIDDYRALLDGLLAVAPPESPIRLTEGAHEYREKLSAFAHGLATADVLTTSFRSHLGKWDGLFARLLLVYHCIECRIARVHPGSLQVNQATARRVHDFMRYFLFPHAASFYGGVMARSERDTAAEWIADWILADRRESVSLRDLMQGYKIWRQMEDWKQRLVMRAMEDAGWLVAVGETTEKRTNKWDVNPKVHTLFGRRAAAAKARKEAARVNVRAAFAQPPREE